MTLAKQFKSWMDDETEEITHAVECAGCGTVTSIEPRISVGTETLAQTLARAASYEGYRIVVGLGWTCGVCRFAVMPTEISGDIHAETGS